MPGEKVGEGDKQKMLSVKDVQEVLGIGNSLMYSLLQSGKIKSVKFGSHYRISQEELGRLIKEGVGHA